MRKMFKRYLKKTVSAAALVAVGALSIAAQEVQYGTKAGERFTTKGQEVVTTKQGKGGGNQMITICHATGSAENPYETLTINQNGVNGHQGPNHTGDIIPAPAGGCPGPTAGPGGNPTPTPEPITMLLFGAGLAGVGYAARRKASRKKKINE